MKCAPLTFQLISALCGVRDGEHAGQQTYLSSLHRHEGSPDSADELADVEEGWDEGDSWRDDSQLFQAEEPPAVVLSLSQISPPSTNGAPSFSSRTARQILRCQNKNRTSCDTGFAADSDEFGGNAEDLAWEDIERPRWKRHRLRRIRNRAVIASTVLAQILYAHNQSANAFQTIMAAYSFASRTGKRVTAVLNQLGLSVSPTTFASALKHNSSAACAVVKEGIQKGRKIGLFYDNLVIYDKKGEESGINKNRSLQLTACGGYFLQLPAESAEEINSVFAAPLPTIRRY